MAKPVGYVSLGCPKALVDSEHIVTELDALGYELTADLDHASTVVINTCGFIDAAKDESFEAIESALDLGKRVVVTGCLGAEAQGLQAKYPALEFVSGPQDVASVVKGVQSYEPLMEHVKEPASPLTSAQAGVSVPPTGAVDVGDFARTRLTPPHYAYLKVSEGCNHSCAFCIIPSMRGKLRSRPIADVLQEAQTAVEQGAKELLVIAQDLSAYGVDMKYAESSWQGKPLATRLFDLCQALGELGVWVRLHYVYPYPHVDQIIPLMRDGLILPYLDIPLQHAAPEILSLMKRPAAAERTLERIHRWREICPELTIRSTFVVGFPGETDAHVGQLLDFLEAAELDRVGCFTYSAVEGASANLLPDHVDETDKMDRQEAVYDVQSSISARRLAGKVGTTLRVLVDDHAENGFIARSSADAPEIDGQVFVTMAGATSSRPNVGEFAWVEITDSDEHDLYGVSAGSGVELK